MITQHCYKTSIIKLKEICPVYTKGFTERLTFKNPCVILDFCTKTKKLVKKGGFDESRSNDTICLFHCDTYETIENDENVLTLKIENYDMNMDTNVSFTDVVTIKIAPNNQNFVQREGMPYFSHHNSEYLIDTRKYDTIILCVAESERNIKKRCVVT